MQQASSGPAATCAAGLFGPAVIWRTVNEPLMHCPLCQVGCVALPEAFTCPATLDRPGRLGVRSLHMSCLTGQARSTGLSENLSLSEEWLTPWLGSESPTQSLSLSDSSGILSLDVPPFFGLTACVLRELSFTVVTGRPPLPTPGNQPQLETCPRPVTDLWLCGGVQVVHRADRGSSQRHLALRFFSWEDVWSWGGFLG